MPAITRAETEAIIDSQIRAENAKARGRAKDKQRKEKLTGAVTTLGTVAVSSAVLDAFPQAGTMLGGHLPTVAGFALLGTSLFGKRPLLKRAADVGVGLLATPAANLGKQLAGYMPR